ncbi:FAD-dependent monooxygenase [Brevundimonas goettingensis]|uniref:FAD-dependent monooxygenase n=2 Tax=Brevundimonas goettingensis TaxID=2774190 RepID=A0A975C709_9CAUL|nr:FAD-dependent monooxygenase [Brevundimonas goettingensis]QTC93165.1 FAD-dependent monooxygenase [Brevundimonas goettingensis]
MASDGCRYSGRGPGRGAHRLPARGTADRPALLRRDLPTDRLRRAPAAAPARELDGGKVRWQSEFKVSHRMAPTMAVGRVALAGDAAHIHSPIGGRGMNLGIEDGYVFAACAVDALQGDLSRIADYARLRHAVDAAWVKTSRGLTGFVTDQSAKARFLKRIAPPIAASLPGLINQALKRGLGLDHPTAVR